MSKGGLTRQKNAAPAHSIEGCDVEADFRGQLTKVSAAPKVLAEHPLLLNSTHSITLRSILTNVAGVLPFSSVTSQYDLQ